MLCALRDIVVLKVGSLPFIYRLIFCYDNKEINMKSYLFIIGALIVVISSLITLNVFFQQSLQMEIANQFNKQQLLLAELASLDMKASFKNKKEDMLSFALMMSDLIRNDEKKLKNKLDEYFNRKPSFKAGVAIFNNKEEMIYSWQNNPSEISDLDYIKNALNLSSGQSIAVNDAYRVYMATPIYSRGVIEGAVLFKTPVSVVADRFLSPVRSDRTANAWIMDKDGTLLYHPSHPEMVGGNIYKANSKCFECHIGFDLEKRILEGRASDYGRHIVPTGVDKILAFSTVTMDNILWIIAVSSPYSVVTYATKRSMNIYSYLIISIFITASVVSGMLIVLNKKRIQAEEIAKREQELEKYALMLENKVRERTDELASEKEKLNSIVSAIGGGIVLIDKNAKIQWANQMIKDMVGMEVVGKYCEELWADCDISASHVKNDIETIILSTFLGQKDRFFQSTTAPVKGEDAEVHGYIRLIQDVTEMKNMEEQIMQSEKLASIGRLAAGIAHEIGNPLTSIFSFIQILREVEEDEFKKESLQTIYFHINRISEILKQLSGFTKMPATESRECRININETIDASINLIQYDKRAKNIIIKKELLPSLPEIVLDCNQLSQIFVNLILNAIDAMPDGGTLTVRGLIKGDDMVIQFEDNGTGIPKKYLTRIFDPFYTTKEKGTGLGLAVSYDIIKKLNGTLTVESEEGKGTIFTIILPIKSS